MGLAKTKIKTNIFIMDKDLWKWAKYKSEILGYTSVSEYIFKLIALDKKNDFIRKEQPLSDL